jgi:tetratricopeptide (TPR) repeat protein
VPAIYNLATLVTLTKPTEAEALYREVIGLSPKDADAHFNLGLILQSLGHRAAGNAQIDIAVAIDPALKR